MTRLTNTCQCFRFPEALPGDPSCGLPKAIQVERTLALGDTATTEVKERAVFTGAYAAFMRDNLAGYNDQDQVFALQSLMVGSGIRINLNSAEVEKLEDAQNPLVVTYEYTIRSADLGQPGPGRLEVPGTWETAAFPIFRNNPERPADIYIHMPTSIHSVSRISLPDGRSASSPTGEHLQFANVFGSVNRSIRMEPGMIQTSFDAAIQSGTFPAAEFNNLYELWTTGQDAAKFSWEIR